MHCGPYCQGVLPLVGHPAALPQGNWELHADQLSLPRLTLTNVTLTCDPHAPPEPPRPLAINISDGASYRGTWRLLSDLQLPAAIYVTRNISMEGVVPYMAPTPLITRDVWMRRTPELVEAGQEAVIDLCHRYEPIQLAYTASVGAL